MCGCHCTGGTRLELSVVLLAKDEPYVHTLKQRIHEVLHDVSHEVLIQDEPGITHAVLQGVRRSKGDLIAVMNGDGSHDVLDLRLMYRLLIYNWRDVNTLVFTTFRTVTRYPVHRQVISLFFKWVTRHLLRYNYKDPLTAFIIAKREVWNLVPDVPGCKFSLEILSRVNPEEVGEFPVHHYPREGHKSKLKPLELWYLFRQVVRLWKEKRRNSSNG